MPHMAWGVAYMRLGRLVTDETRALSQFYARYSTTAHWLKNSKDNPTLLNPFTVDAVLQDTLLPLVGGQSGL